VTASLVAVRIPGSRSAWTALGFGGVEAIAFHNGAVEFGTPDDGVPALVVGGVDLAGDQIDGVPVSIGTPVAAGAHANTAFELDHVVVLTDSLDRTSAAVTAVLGLPCRRVREVGSVRQAFHRFADTPAGRGCILEIVEQPDVERPSLWGVVINVADLDALCRQLGPDVVSDSKPAVQLGRRIAGVRAAVGLGLAVALMTPA
jgi:hypothetical protein